jgi:hypothetical protein
LMLFEIRSTGHQTMVPPSIHPSRTSRGNRRLSPGRATRSRAPQRGRGRDPNRGVHDHAKLGRTNQEYRPGADRPYSQPPIRCHRRGHHIANPRLRCRGALGLCATRPLACRAAPTRINPGGRRLIIRLSGGLARGVATNGQITGFEGDP